MTDHDDAHAFAEDAVRVFAERMTCPTCGVPVELTRGGEGTCSYRPAVDAQPLVEFAQWIVTAAELSLVRPLLVLDEIVDRAGAALAEYEGRAEPSATR